MTKTHPRWQPLLTVTFAAVALCVVAPAQSKLQSGTSDQQRQPPALQADPRTMSSPAPTIGAGAPTEVRQDYRISPGDVVDIQVDRATELSGSYRVTSAGVFQMLYLGKVMAKDRTQEELATFIADGLRGRYLKNPRVMVVVRPSVATTAALFIQGSVRAPGIYQIQGRASLLKLISYAGGLDPHHGSTAFVIREIESAASGVEETASGSGKAGDSPQAPGKTEPGYQMKQQANVNALYRGDLSQDALLEAGDIVVIPEADVFFVAGEVKRPGSFPLREGTTLSQAISLAEGTTFKGSGEGFIIRDDPTTGRRIEIRVDIKAAMKGRNDVFIQPNDIIRVPSSGLKSAASVLLTGFGYSMIRVPRTY